MLKLLRFFSISTSLVAISFGALASSGSFSVNPSLLIMSPNSNKPSCDHKVCRFVVENNSDKTAYIMVKMRKYIKPGSIPQQFLSFDQSKSRQSFGITVAPSMFVLKPDSSRTVQIINLAANNPVDNVYMVDVSNAKGPLMYKHLKQGEAKAGIAIDIAYGVKVVVRPMDPKAALELKQSKSKLTVSNHGNTSIYLKKMLCTSAQGITKPCAGTQFTPLRIYANDSLTYTVPANQRVSFEGIGLKGKVKTYS